MEIPDEKDALTENEPLTENEIIRLPRRARVALAARCVQRVMPATVGSGFYWRAEARKYLIAIETVIACARLLSISVEDAGNRGAALLEVLSKDYLKMLDEVGRPRQWRLFRRTILAKVLWLFNYRPVVAIMDAARGAFEKMASGRIDEETSSEYNAAVLVARAASCLCADNVDWLARNAAGAAAEISTAATSADTFDAAYSAAYPLYAAGYHANPARAAAARADPAYDSAYAVVTAARSTQCAKRATMVASIAAATRADFDWLLKNCPADADSIVPRDCFNRPLWPSGLPHDWQKILDNWREALRMIGLEDMWLRHESLLKGTPLNWDDVCQLVESWSRCRND